MVGMKNNKFRFGAAVCICLLTLFITVTGPVSAKTEMEPRLVVVLITSNTGDVLLYARLIDCFREEMEAAILAGVPAIFTLQLDVYQERPYLWDKHIVGKEIRSTIKYDNLKKTFLVATNGADQPGIYPNFESAQKAMADLSGIPLIPISALSRGNNYYAQIKVKIDRVRLPFNMEYVLFFVSLWDFETPLYKVRFSY
jgi:hypothetical protein